MALLLYVLVAVAAVILATIMLSARLGSHTTAPRRVVENANPRKRPT